MDGLVERGGALPMWYWIALTAIVIALVLWLVLRTPRRRLKIERQQRYVEALEDADQAHPGMYEAELERERAKLGQLRQ